MKTLILTGWIGAAHTAMAEHTAPLMQAYANRHGHDFSALILEGGDRPASWNKLPALYAALETYDAVAWIDADVVIAWPGSDIIAELQPGTCQAVVEHLTECGRVPNCGVWVVSKEMQPTLQQAWDDGSAFVHHPWWEQAAIMRLMGYAVEPGPHGKLDSPTRLYERTTFLRPEWNHHPGDINRPDDPHFVHVTQYDDRLSLIANLAKLASGA
jgi:hypothetical protein